MDPENSRAEVDEKGALQELVKKQAEEIVVWIKRLSAANDEITRLREGLTRIIAEDDARPRQIKDTTLRQMAVEILDPNRMKLT
jgi:hypothetical protein